MNNLLSFFSREIYFFWYFFIKSCIFYFTFNCFWTILWSFRNFCDFISNFITNQSTSCFCSFFNCFFEAVCLAWSRSFWLYLPLTFLPTNLPCIFSETIISYIPPNALPSSDESVQIKHFSLSIRLSLLCVPFLLGSIWKCSMEQMYKCALL